MLTDVKIIDAREESCPMPLLLLARALSTLQSDEILTLLLDPNESVKDIKRLCHARGYLLLSEDIVDECRRINIKKD